MSVCVLRSANVCVWRSRIREAMDDVSRGIFDRGLDKLEAGASPIPPPLTNRTHSTR